MGNYQVTSFSVNKNTYDVFAEYDQDCQDSEISTISIYRNDGELMLEINIKGWNL